MKIILKDKAKTKEIENSYYGQAKKLSLYLTFSYFIIFTFLAIVFALLMMNQDGVGIVFVVFIVLVFGSFTAVHTLDSKLFENTQPLTIDLDENIIKWEGSHYKLSKEFKYSYEKDRFHILRSSEQIFYFSVELSKGVELRLDPVSFSEVRSYLEKNKKVKFKEPKKDDIEGWFYS